MPQHSERRRRDTKAPHQVAVIALRRKKDDVEVCLIRRQGSRTWSIPKGFIDDGNTREQAALTEAHEEAGLQGRVRGRTIGTYEYQKRGARFVVAVYVMEVLRTQAHWMEESFRDRRWTPLDDATSLLKKHPVRRIWNRVRPRLASRLR